MAVGWRQMKFFMTLVTMTAVFLAIWAACSYWSFRRATVDAVASDIVLDVSDLLVRAQDDPNFSSLEEALFAPRAMHWDSLLRTYRGDIPEGVTSDICGKLVEIEKLTGLYSRAKSRSYRYPAIDEECSSVGLK